jgi:hypothetical protein
MAELSWRDSWVWALLLFGLYGLLSPDLGSSLVGLGLLGAWALERRAVRRAEGRSGRGAQTVLAAGSMILGGLIHLGQVGPLRAPTTPEGAQNLARLFLAICQVLWSIAEVRRVRRDLERGE